MFEFLARWMLQIPSVFLSAVGLAIGGAIFVEYMLRVHRNEMAARATLIAPWTHTSLPLPAHSPSAMEEPLLLSADLSSAEREVARRLKKFGIPVRYMSALLLAARLLAAPCLGIGFWFLAPHLMAMLASPMLRTLLSACAGLFGWFLPVIIARRSAKKRATAVVAGLPDALELLVICAEGGLALADGIDRIVVELRRSQPELAEELALTAADLKILPSQDQALSRLAARIDVPILHSVVTTLSQTMRYGTPVAQAIRVVAAEMRNEAIIRMEERANKLPALLTVPMILFILPTIFLVIAGPVALRTIDTFLR